VASERGFTLVEVMVALMVVAVALPALLKTLYQQIDGTAYLREQTLGQWVASNHLAEVRIELARSNQFFRGERSGVDVMADQDFYWWMNSEPTQVPDFYRLEISVAMEETDQASPIYTLVGFIHATNVAAITQ
jgi:general secretion pathway protein I